MPREKDRTAWRENLIWIIGLTALFEALAILFRYGFQLESTSATSALRHLTFGLRVHHGYIGAAMGLLAWRLGDRLPWGRWVVRLGVSFVASDLIHHFCVLWPIEGDPQFDLVYPE